MVLSVWRGAPCLFLCIEDDRAPPLLDNHAQYVRLHVEDAVGVSFPFSHSPPNLTITYLYSYSPPVHDYPAPVHGSTSKAPRDMLRREAQRIRLVLLRVVVPQLASQISTSFQFPVLVLPLSSKARPQSSPPASASANPPSLQATIRRLRWY
jgi:hypothetical protein